MNDNSYVEEYADSKILWMDNDILEKQVNIIKALTYAPNVLVNYIHYRGKEKIRLEGLPMKITDIPFIPYNDPNICCLLDKINGSNKINNACNRVIVKALGPKGKIGTPYIIVNEELTDDIRNTLVVKISKIKKLHSTYSSSPSTALNFFTASRDKTNKCLSNIELKNIRYIASDEFTNETLISYVLNYLITQYQIPLLFVRHYQSGICGENNNLFGLNIMENCNLGSLDSTLNHPLFKNNLQQHQINDNGRQFISSLVNKDIIFQIFTQIVIGLDILQSYLAFISGDLKVSNIFLKSEPIDINYIGIKLKSQFTCKIADYGKSSCMLYKSDGTAIRFYNDSSLANAYLTIHPFTDNIDIIDNNYFYSINYPFTSQLYTRTRHMGIPFYHSFDYYTVLVSTLTIPHFYYMFFSDNNLINIFWTDIWKDNDDSIEAMNRIHQFVLEKKGQNMSDAINILKGLKLKCDAIKLVIKNLINIQ